jgi:hypothetical protein
LTVAGLLACFPFERAQAGDFLNPAPAQLDSQFRNNRLGLESQRRNYSNIASASAFSGTMAGGGAALSYDEYQQSGAYQNVIWIPLENIGEGATINVNVGDSQQSADGSTTGASNEVSEGTNTTMNNGHCGSSAVLNAASCGTE